MSKDMFIQDLVELKRWRELIKQKIHLRKEFPEQVFKDPCEMYLFEEFDWLWWSDESWPMLQKLAACHHDEYILVASLECYRLLKSFYKEYGYIYWAKASLKLTSEEFLDLLAEGPSENDFNSIMTLASRVVITSPSLKWMIYTERDTELSVLSAENISNIFGHMREMASWSVLNEDVLDRASVAFYDQEIPKAFKKELYENYGYVKRDNNKLGK
ncbi:hypothetical protein [Shouchella lonarensis]|uniref:Uncharacterized protein n=1 Tax=Shouchella lonarensis TaxID=1464122 RepID=A0A1G6GJZ9_9BACI|nr:hypothetical protein [Shouchella lonarensis]SDB82317.1 hypothetical protein SAMN05421737_101169 [Shouchella lonarensis]